MEENFENPATIEGQEGDGQQLDTVDKVREWGKGWETSAKTYEPSHKFITEKFGNLEQAEVSASVFDSLFGEEFNPNNFLETVNKISPKRGETLTKHFAESEAVKLVPNHLKEMFGFEPTKEDIALYKEFKKSGGFGQGDKLPEYLRFNADGTPKSDEEIKFYQELQERVNAIEASRQEELQSQKQREEEERQSQIAKQVDEFASNRLGILDKEFSDFGLDFKQEDTEEVRMEKQIIRKFISDGVAGIFLQDKVADDYMTAVQYIKNGEGALARRYEPRIEAKLVEIFRSKPIQKLLANIKTESTEDDSKIFGNDQEEERKALPQGFNAKEAIKNLFATGQIVE